MLNEACQRSIITLKPLNALPRRLKDIVISVCLVVVHLFMDTNCCTYRVQNRVLDVFKPDDRPIYLDLNRMKPYRLLNAKKKVNFFDLTTSVTYGFSQNMH